MMHHSIFDCFRAGAIVAVVGLASSPAHAGVGGADLRSTAAVTEPLESFRSLNLGSMVREIHLDGDWQAGIDRHYDRIAHVPGLATDPTRPTTGTLWLRRQIHIPAGKWTDATLTLKGARFAPSIYLDGKLVSHAAGGMAPTSHLLHLPNNPSSRSITLEIALESLNELDPQDASAVPEADRWRTNISSCLWDSVVLRLHGPADIARMNPWPDMEADTINMHYQLRFATGPSQSTIAFEILDSKGRLLRHTGQREVHAADGSAVIALHHALSRWNPDSPKLYRLRALLYSRNRLIDAREISLGLRSFHVRGLGFELNDRPFRIRAGSVVWHRWTRDPEARELAFEPDWFERNVVLRLKDLGANGLRFHLGLPPEAFLDLCDRDGLVVQMEWPFFHGIAASGASMEEQWRAWLDVAMHHPSVVIVHPWNETEGDQLQRAWTALNAILPEYPPLVVSHRDVLHIHKYWWSLFENLGLYYDSAAQFGKAAMVDEFGGNYLDGNGDPGSYPTVHETFLRFLGPNPTRDQRLELHTEANARVAEYWRRLGVAGFSPFCILGSPQDGNHWYLGSLAHPKPKPVWAALAAAYSPLSLSLDIWNRNFSPAETITVPLYFFNDTDRSAVLHATVELAAEGKGSPVKALRKIDQAVPAHQTIARQIDVTLPGTDGSWILQARLENPPDAIKHPVISAWKIRTVTVQLPSNLVSAVIGIPKDETELRDALRSFPLAIVDVDSPKATVLIASERSWKELTEPSGLRHVFDAVHKAGRPIVLLDIGPRHLGQGYQQEQSRDSLQSAPQAPVSKVERFSLFGGIDLAFHQVAEPESHLQPAGRDLLWYRIAPESTWLWNGLRGGLIAPADDMQVSGSSIGSLLAQWQARGADPTAIGRGNYYAYELAGYYEYSQRPDDNATLKRLRQRVRFLVQDAPSLKHVIDPDSPISVINLSETPTEDHGESRVQLIPLASAGKNLTRTPVVELRFSRGAGRLLLSQLLTAGRLARSAQEKAPYGIRYDPVAMQFVLNLLNEGLAP